MTGTEIYVDTDSKVRKGDLATITTKVAGSPETGTLEVDCKLRKIFYKGEELRGFSDQQAAMFLSLGCKRIWEVWK